MIRTYTKDNKEELKLLSKASKKFDLNENEIDLVSTDRFLFLSVYLLAISKKKLYLLTSDSKKVEVFDTKEIENLKIDNKVDLKLYLRNGRKINLTSVVYAKKGDVKSLKTFANGMNKYI